MVKGEARATQALASFAEVGLRLLLQFPPSTCFKITHFLSPLRRFDPCWDGAEVLGFWGVWQLLQFLSW